MKQLISFISHFFLLNFANAQFGGVQIIDTTSIIILDVHTADIDSDGDMDVVYTEYLSLGPNKVAWYENLGNGIFGQSNTISTSYFNPHSVYTADLDGDGDIDILTASMNDTIVAWHENLGGGIIDTTRQIIPNNALGASSVYAADLDNDGDMDVLSAYRFDNIIAWNENLGNGVFGAQQILSNIAVLAEAVYASDIDGDGDSDVLYAARQNQKIGWVENLGGGVFGLEQIILNSDSGTYDIYPADLDGDGDQDVLSVSFNTQAAPNGKVGWYENLGNGTFGVQQILSITPNVYNPKSVYASDLDGDGDIDVISSDVYGLKWYQNLGGGAFNLPVIVSQYPTISSIIADIDSDGDMDILAEGNGVVPYYYIGWHEVFYNSSYQLKGQVFYDANQNKKLDTNELGLSSIQTTSQPNPLMSFTNNNGNYFFATDTGEYIIGYVIDSLWNLITDSTSFTQLLTGAIPVIDSLNFGFYPDTVLTLIKPSLGGGTPRCNNQINYWVNIQNLGTTMPSGVIHLQLHDSIAFIASAISPDSIIGQNIYWEYDSLFFFSSKTINLQVQMPSVLSLGDTLKSSLIVYEHDSLNNIVYSNTDTLQQVLVCAIDPNDKSVTPKGIGPQGYIANNQELEYLIRFQNTGNDTAITVMVRDQLDSNLNWSTMQIGSYSHPMQVWVEQDGEAVFKFENIMLPDSNVDFLGSQGFVKFKIKPDTGLAPNTPIFNTGHIYFDFNPAVITNTVLNTIDTTNSTVSIKEIEFTNSKEVIVFPNPFQDNLTIYYKGKIEDSYNLVLFDVTGKKVYNQENITNNKTTINLNQLSEGLYIAVGTDNLGKRLFSERIMAQ